MRFDDRLLTVLNQPAGDRHDAAIRWRQLVDLVARAGSNAASPTVGQALESIRAEAPNVDDSLRAAAARAVAALPLPLALLEYFASDRLTVSAPVLAAATLESAQWHALLGAADEETRRFIETLHPEIRSEPSPDLTQSLVESPTEAEAPAEPAAPSLHEVVQRIERRRRSRSIMKRGGGIVSPRESAPALFRWECGPGGEIAWVDGAPRGAVIGRSIARVLDGEQLDPEVVRAFMLRAPFRDGTLAIAGEGPLSGEWKISGVPAFEPADGRFAGYRGVALRDQEEAPAADQQVGLLSDPDSVRELVHEIKTPLNAIIGFAEIIEGQYLGPADRKYRERAQEIVRQARMLLTAIDDLDFAAKVHSSAAGEQWRVNLGELIQRMIPALRDLAQGRGAELDGLRAIRDATAATEPELADRLIFRMCSAVIGQAERGERLRLTLERTGDRSRVSIARPASLRKISEEQLLGSEGQLEQGFSLRLVRGLARLAGADLVAPRDSISLLFPRA
ncbi:MAG TPA: histidine kinase dimerization/phospho-acceptor domain-containing protein [Sphingomicrobium sp.]|nr:histidine kinase dimerization/phospho-acceptor domain-containing protein [Sphingomicrobium sp.]